MVGLLNWKHAAIIEIVLILYYSKNGRCENAEMVLLLANRLINTHTIHNLGHGRKCMKTVVYLTVKFDKSSMNW